MVVKTFNRALAYSVLPNIFVLCHHCSEIDYYFKACRKVTPEAKAVIVNESAVRAIADTSEITGLPRDNFEVHEISKEEFEKIKRNLAFKS